MFSNFYRKSKGFNMPSLCKLKIDFGPIPFKFSNFPNNGNKKWGLNIYKNLPNELYIIKGIIS